MDHDEHDAGVSGITTRVPKMVFPPNLLPGVYANQIQQLTNERETVLDFGNTFLSSYDRDDEGRLVDLTVENRLVARIVVPTSAFEEFIRAYLARHPGFLDPSGQDTREGER